jgi:hypothetical protein
MFPEIISAPEKNLDLTKIRIVNIQYEKYRRLAVTHYRVLQSKERTKVFFEVPVGSCGYWVETQGSAVDDFFVRFDEMTKEPRVQGISNPSQPTPGHSTLLLSPPKAEESGEPKHQSSGRHTNTSLKAKARS